MTTARLLVLLSVFAGVHEIRSESLETIIIDYWTFKLREQPVLATLVGVRDFDDRLGDQSPAAFERRRAANHEFAGRLATVDTSTLSATDRVNRALLMRMTTEYAKGVEVGYHFVSGMTTYQPWYTSFASLPGQLPFLTQADYESYIARLRDFPRYCDGGIQFMQAAIDAGVVQPRESLVGTESGISAHLVDDVESSVFFGPLLECPGSIPEAARLALQAAARDAISVDVIPAYRRLLAFYQEHYLPAARSEIGATSLPGGNELYAFAIRSETTTELDADQIHEIGLAEVARIRAEMDQVIGNLNFAGTFTDFQQFLRTDPTFYSEDTRDYLARAAYIAKRIDGELPKLFGRLPRTPFTIKPIPDAIADKTSTAYAQPSSPDGSVAGVYYLNTSRLSERPLFELEALTLHEARPGHLLQITLANELDLPDFRRTNYSFTAFVEGWGLYAERLGLEVGIYTDPYSNFGRLSYEMWRACRLVVDTGIHSRNWTRDQSVNYMLQHTSLTRHNIETEVDRYITWPAQALAYKLGELKIRELRRRAETKLGERFDRRAFHDAVLANGAVPLDILESQIDQWISRQ